MKRTEAPTLKVGRILLATVATFLLVAGGAHAAVDVRVANGALVIDGTTSSEVVNVSPPTSASAGRLRVLSGAGVTPGAGCVVESSTVVRCTDQAVLRADMDAGTDRLSVTHSIRCDVCFMGSGDDEFVSTLSEADVVDGETGADDLDARGGTDGVLYTSRLNDMRIDLNGDDNSGDMESSADGNSGNKDRLRGFENAYGGGGADDFVGNGSNNRFVGGASADDFVGGVGTDTVSYLPDVYSTTHSNRGVTAIIGGGPVSGEAIDRFGGTGDDIHADIENLKGGNNGDRLVGRSGPNVLDGNAGNDTLEGGSGRDTLNGHDGSDTASYADHSESVAILIGAGLAGGPSDGAEGARDTIASDVENFLGGSAADSLSGTSGPNVLDGGPGSDTIDGNGGVDTLSYATRDQGVTVTLASGITSRVQGGALDGAAGARDGISEIENATGSSGPDTLTGNSENIRTGTGGVNVLRGGAGDDVLDGAGASDDLIGDSGADTASYATRSTAVVATASTSTSARTNGNAVDGAEGARDLFSSIENLRGGSTGDTLNGSTAANRLEGNSGPDSLSGSSNDDTLIGGPGADSHVGGSGLHDVVSYEDRTDPVQATLATNDASGNASDGPPSIRDDIAADVEDLTGGGGADTLTGTDGPNTLIGGGGNDTLRARGGVDRLEGGLLDDVLESGLGNDVLIGNGGADTASYADRTVEVTATLGTASGNGEADESDNFAADIERLEGGGGNDTLTGSTGANRLSGNGGGDRLDGSTGADELRGGDGRDGVTYEGRSASVVVVVGAAGASGNSTDGAVNGRDTIDGDVEGVRGTSGNDTLTGDGGSNQLEGLGGDDTLDGGFGADLLEGGGNTDTATYAARTTAVDTTLGAEDVSGNDDDGAPGNRDSLLEIENLTGGARDDTLTGDGSVNVLRGGDGDDTLDGGGAGDQLIGEGGGHDVATYESRTTPVVAQLTLTGASGNEVDGTTGARDTLASTTEGVRGGSGADLLIGSDRSNSHPGADFLEGGPGADRLQAGTGPDEIDGGDGGDTAFYDTRSAAVTASLDGTATSGNSDDGPAGARDTIEPNVENLVGGAGGDTLNGSPQPNTLSGGNGADHLNGFAGADTLDGEDGIDTAHYDERTTSVTLELGAPNASGNADDGPLGVRDTIDDSVERAVGGSGDDTLTGTAGDDGLDGGGGTDVLDGRAGADSLVGGPGTLDRVSYGDRTTPVHAEIGGGSVSGNEVDASTGPRDSIDGSVERLIGGTHNDELIGNELANRLEGGRGADTLQGMAGRDTVFGGSGLGDVASYAERATTVTVVLGGGPVSGDDTDGGPTSRDDVRGDVEGIAGGSGPDDLQGTPGANRLIGGPGPDTLRGLAGDDELLGEGADDTLDGGADRDELRGGDGSDTVTYESRATSVTAVLDGTSNSGNAEDGAAGARDSIFADVENLTGGDGGDTLTGNASLNRLTGNDGPDDLSGAGEADELVGGRDADLLRGGDGDDSLDGGGAGDDLRGQDGVDLVTYASRASAVNVEMGVAGASGNADDGAAGARDSINVDVEDLEGTSDDDTLAGSANDNTIDGGEGVDVIRGLGGLDTITYAGRPDPVTVRLGAIRGSGNDVDGPVGNRDTVEVDVERVVGTSGDDKLTGSGADNILEGGLGADDFAGGGGTDTVTYETRTLPVQATIGGSGGSSQDSNGSRRDVIAIDVENLIGGAAGDTLTGDDGNPGSPPDVPPDAGVNRLEGRDGGDTLAGGKDPDRFIGGDGNDTVTYASSTSGVVARIGSAGASGSAEDGPAGSRDTIDFDVENLIGSGTGSDDLTGSGVANRIEGLDGDDTLKGLQSDDVLLGGPSDDELDGGSGADTMSGGTGPSPEPEDEADVVTYETRSTGVDATIGPAGASGNADDGAAGSRDTIQSDVERLEGGSGGDTLTGSEIANVITGNAGADTVNGRGGGDTIAAGAGIDTVNGEGGADTVDGGLDGDTITGGPANDELSGGDGADTISGGEGDDRLPGGAGDDTLNGEAGLDVLFGEADRDTLDGGVDRDISSGGTGIDTATYFGRTEDVVMIIGEDFVSGSSLDAEGENLDTINTDVENLLAGEGDDTLVGNADGNRLVGAGGDDDIFGGTGNDTLRGSSGDDELDGEADNDTILGEAGLDTLIGGFGLDTLSGGIDDDDLRIRDGAQDTATCDAGGSDTVTADAIDSVDGTCETVLLP